jgi:hypothetical protein
MGSYVLKVVKSAIFIYYLCAEAKHCQRKKGMVEHVQPVPFDPKGQRVPVVTIDTTQAFEKYFFQKVGF